MHNKKATIGATTTWIVATIIIIVLCVIFIYIVSSLGFVSSLFGSSSYSDKSQPELRESLFAIMKTQINGAQLGNLIANDASREKEEQAKVTAATSPIIKELAILNRFNAIYLRVYNTLTPGMNSYYTVFEELGKTYQFLPVVYIGTVSIGDEKGERIYYSINKGWTIYLGNKND